ncbi:hypothetical protein V525_19155 [Gordonia alkanivorans CGMCC 6845]|uniref:Uncharacterized protein n=1 Tax=Gordonia alkanivorans CGMCC 6845 TaxID=1423140 RepID=W9DG68_9ACTN|nr:hypothetical protein V525_19155 [Gordonia alkanivorans CGMCC 6845]
METKHEDILVYGRRFSAELCVAPFSDRRNQDVAGMGDGDTGAGGNPHFGGIPAQDWDIRDWEIACFGLSVSILHWGFTARDLATKFRKRHSAPEYLGIADHCFEVPIPSTEISETPPGGGLFLFLHDGCQMNFLQLTFQFSLSVGRGDRNFEGFDGVCTQQVCDASQCCGSAKVLARFAVQRTPQPQWVNIWQWA